MSVWIYSILSVVLVSLISFVGIISISLDEKRLKKILIFMVSFAVGALFGDVFIHILPDIYKNPASNASVSFLVLSGIFLFFILEKFIWWRHCHSGECDMHTKPVVTLNLFGDALHNFLDGIIIAASYMASIPLGIATTVAVVLHEIPQEIGDFAVLVNGGLSRSKALALNFLCASVSAAGAVVALSIGPNIKDFSSFVLPLTAGGFIYIAGSDLIPELHKEVRFSRSLLQLVSAVLGVLVMALLLLME